MDGPHGARGRWSYLLRRFSLGAPSQSIHLPRKNTKRWNDKGSSSTPGFGSYQWRLEGWDRLAQWLERGANDTEIVCSNPASIICPEQRLEKAPIRPEQDFINCFVGGKSVW